VLSGLEDNLRLYEVLVRCELTRLCPPGNEEEDRCVKQEDGDEGREAKDPTAEWFDVKYCQLRNDIPIEKQLFDSLSVKITKEVVSLIDEPTTTTSETKPKHNSTKKDKEARQRRSMRRRAEQERNRRMKTTLLTTSSMLIEDVDSVSNSLVDNDDVDIVENDEGKTKTTTLSENDTLLDNKFHHGDSNNGYNDAFSSFTATPTIQQNKNVESSAIPPVLKDLPPVLKDWAKTPPAVNLSPSEWNDKLLALSTTLSLSHSSSSNNSASEIVSSKMNNRMDNGDDDDTSINYNEGELLYNNNNNNNNNTNNVILLDARNMYETRIGHFAIPNISTVLPNTRKFSNLPSVLNTNEAATALSGKDVYMYCTGGVRCERASSYLRALSESNAGAWANVVPPKAIYQLHGGIQAYLEVYGTVEEQPQHDGVEEEGVLEDDCGNEVDVTPTTATTTSLDLMVKQMNIDSHEGDKVITASAQGELTHHPMNSMKTSSCLYRGKNFVFDQRRTDPIIGNGIITTNTNEDDISAIIVDNTTTTTTTTTTKSSKVGRCIICSSLHDDYDNGFAPCDNREARCCRCRVLILVCNTCRANVRCWGEQSSEEEQNSVDVDGGRSNNDSSCGTNPPKMDIYCGISGMVCVDDGNIVGNIEVARY
jgi:predicted sulfurtransferase